LFSLAFLILVFIADNKAETTVAPVKSHMPLNFLLFSPTACMEGVIVEIWDRAD